MSVSRAARIYIDEHISSDNVLLDEPMSRHTSFRVGGPAEVFINVSSSEELLGLVSYFSKLRQEYFVLGNGSNLLVSDKGYSGVVLKIGTNFEDISVSGNIIKAGSGALLSKVACAARDNNLTGMEFAAGIPGSVGGAMIMNAGAYGGEMKQIVKEVSTINDNGEEVILTAESMGFGYRTSAIKGKPYVVTSVTFELGEGNREQIQACMDELAFKRREKQPLEFPSAGSTFKRPEGYFAGKLIMDAGLRGYCIGGAQVSEKHCGFIINKGSANAADIKDLIDEVSQIVKTKFGVSLEPEIIFLGEF